MIKNGNYQKSSSLSVKVKPLGAFAAIAITFIITGAILHLYTAKLCDATFLYLFPSPDGKWVAIQGGIADFPVFAVFDKQGHTRFLRCCAACWDKFEDWFHCEPAVLVNRFSRRYHATRSYPSAVSVGVIKLSILTGRETPIAGGFPRCYVTPDDKQILMDTDTQLWHMDERLRLKPMHLWSSPAHEVLDVIPKPSGKGYTLRFVSYSQTTKGRQFGINLISPSGAVRALSPKFPADSRPGSERWLVPPRGSTVVSVKPGLGGMTVRVHGFNTKAVWLRHSIELPEEEQLRHFWSPSGNHILLAGDKSYWVIETTTGRAWRLRHLEARVKDCFWAAWLNERHLIASDHAKVWKADTMSQEVKLLWTLPVKQIIAGAMIGSRQEPAGCPHVMTPGG